MVMVIGLTQLVAYQYARGAALTAAERGVRTASVSGGSAGDCERAVAESLEGVLGGTVGAGLEFACSEEGGVMVARVRGTVPAWTPGGLNLSFEVVAQAVRERDP